MNKWYEICSWGDLQLVYISAVLKNNEMKFGHCGDRDNMLHFTYTCWNLQVDNVVHNCIS